MIFETEPRETRNRFDRLGLVCHVHGDDLEYPKWDDFGAEDDDWRFFIPDSAKEAWPGLNYSEKLAFAYMAEQMLLATTRHSPDEPQADE